MYVIVKRKARAFWARLGERALHVRLAAPASVHKLLGVLHRSRSEALQSGAEAQVQHLHNCLHAALQVSATSLDQDLPARNSCLSAGGPCIPAGPDIHLLSKTPKSPHRRLSLCSLPVPKQFRESLRSLTPFAQSPNGGTWQPAHRNNPDVFSLLRKVFSCCRGGSEFLGRHEILPPAIHREQICNQFPGHGKCSPIRVSSFSFLLVKLR